MTLEILIVIPTVACIIFTLARMVIFGIYLLFDSLK